MQSELWQGCLNLIAEDEVEQFVCCLCLVCVAQDYSTLADLRIGVGRNESKAARVTKLGRQSNGLRDETELSVSALGELCCLCDRFGKNDMRHYVRIVVQLFESVDCRRAVGSVIGICDGHGF